MKRKRTFFHYYRNRCRVESEKQRRRENYARPAMKLLLLEVCRMLLLEVMKTCCCEKCGQKAKRAYTRLASLAWPRCRFDDRLERGIERGVRQFFIYASFDCGENRLDVGEL
jgi:hypothetical protein